MPTVNIDFNAIFSEIENQVKNLALATASKYKDQAIDVGQRIVADMKDDLIRWTQMLANEQLSTDEFELLVKSYEVEGAVAGLELAGLAHVRAYDFGMSVLNVIMDVIMKVLNSLGSGLLQPK
ncbi:MAG TPA: hypothetical protein VG603_10250 [Chitinophagales bacterium]|nr:hypothetical protein [Chitinophagales bacterium]